MYKDNVIDYIWSEDSDILVYDCKNIIKGLKMNGDCFILNEEILSKFMNRVLKKKFYLDEKETTKKYKAAKFFKLTPS